MPIILNDTQLVYVCKNMLGVEGTPNFSDQHRARIYSTLKKCDSYLELMAFLGMCYYIQGSSFTKPCNVGYVPVTFVDIGEAIVITNSEAWMESKKGWYNLMVVPQLQTVVKSRYNNKHSITLTHDFGFFIPKLITSVYNKHQMLCIVEVDGYAVHKDRRDKDAVRDNSVQYPVIRLLEEKVDLLTWFRYLDPGSPEFIFKKEEQEQWETITS